MLLPSRPFTQMHWHNYSLYEYENSKVDYDGLKAILKITDIQAETCIWS